MSNSDKLKGLVVPATTRAPKKPEESLLSFLRRISKEAGGEDITYFQGRRKMCFHSNVIAGMCYHGNHYITCKVEVYCCLATLGLHFPLFGIINLGCFHSDCLLGYSTIVNPPTFLYAFERTRPVYLIVYLSVCPSVTEPCYLFTISERIRNILKVKTSNVKKLWVSKTLLPCLTDPKWRLSHVKPIQRMDHI